MTIKKLKIKKIPIHSLLYKIVVHQPAPGSLYQINKPISIEWDKNFGNYEFAHITVYNFNGIKIKGFTCSNTGISSWEPDSIYNSQSLYIEINSQDNKFSGKSGNFTILELSQIL